MARPELMCSYSNIGQKTPRPKVWGTTPTEALFAVKSKRIRCPVCGRSMWSSVMTCHDGCCIFHCIPPHKIKGWWKKPKKKSRDIRMKRR